MLRDLERTKQRYLAEEIEIYFDDITDAAERIWDILENYKEVVEALEDDERVGPVPPAERRRSGSSPRSSVLVLPLTLVASIFGMNVKVPGERDIGAFWVILVAMAALLVGLVFVLSAGGAGFEPAAAADQAGRSRSAGPV